MTQSFFEVCEFEFHPTNVGKFFKENDIPPIGKTKEGNNLYDGSHWDWLFKHLYHKAVNRCSYESNLTLPRDDKSIQDCPEYYTEEIIIQKDFSSFNKPLNNKNNQTFETIDLIVPFSDNQQVKNLGAKWNPEKKTWYEFKNDDYLKFFKWIPKDIKAEKRKKKLERFLIKRSG